MPSKKHQRKIDKAREKASRGKAEANAEAKDDDVEDEVQALPAQLRAVYESSSSTTTAIGDDWIFSWRPPNIDPRDDIERASRWMAMGMVDSYGLAKYLPFTANNVKEGRTDPYLFAADLEVFYDKEFIYRCQYYANRIAWILLPPEKLILGSDGGEQLKQKYDDLCREIRMSTVHALADVFHNDKDFTKHHDAFEAYATSGNSNGFDWTIFCSAESHCKWMMSELCVPIEKLLRRTCAEYADRIDEDFFGGKKGTFLRSCPLLQVPGIFLQCLNDTTNAFAFNHNYEELFDFASTRYELRVLCRTCIFNGSYEVRTTCWECGKAADRLMECERCHAACYCSSECQAKAWNEGHKGKCKILKKQHAAVLEGLDSVDAAYDRGFSINGVRLGHARDYTVAGHLYDFEMHPVPDLPWAEASFGPSMDVYYKNIDLIAKGEWWVFPEPDNPADFERKLTVSETAYMLELHKRLFYDFYGLINEGGAAQLGTTVELVTDSCNKFAERMVEQYGAAISAEYFIEKYLMERRRFGREDPIERSRWRRQERVRFLGRLRREFHK